MSAELVAQLPKPQNVPGPTGKCQKIIQSLNLPHICVEFPANRLSPLATSPPASRRPAASHLPASPTAETPTITTPRRPPPGGGLHPHRAPSQVSLPQTCVKRRRGGGRSGGSSGSSSRSSSGGSISSARTSSGSRSSNTNSNNSGGGNGEVVYWGVGFNGLAARHRTQLGQTVVTSFQWFRDLRAGWFSGLVN